MSQAQATSYQQLEGLTSQFVTSNPQTRRGDLKGKIRREAFAIAFECLVEPNRRHAIKSGKIGVENHALPANREDEMFNGIFREFGRCWAHRRGVCPAACPCRHPRINGKSSSSRPSQRLALWHSELSAPPRAISAGTLDSQPGTAAGSSTAVSPATSRAG
jgi:hypothetical protein